MVATWKKVRKWIADTKRANEDALLSCITEEIEFGLKSGRTYREVAVRIIARVREWDK